MTTKHTCLACGGSALAQVRPYRAESDAGRPLFGAAFLLRCDTCGLVQMAPIPSRDKLEAYYARDYRLGGRHGSGVADISGFPRDNMFYFHRGRSIAALAGQRLADAAGETPRILDVGAGWGHILHAFGERFPKAERFAIEISQPCVDHLRSLGFTVFQQPIEDALATMTETFDFVILSHVLEHLRDPVGTLRLLRERLTPKGMLYVEVPHIPADSLTRYPDHAWAPRHDEPHLTFFSPDTLKGTLGGAGLAVQFCEPAGPDYAYVSRETFTATPLKSKIIAMVPEFVKRELRKRRIGHQLSVFDHEEPFFRYGGSGIWLRSISGR